MRLPSTNLLLASFMLIQFADAAYMPLPNTDVTSTTILNPVTALYQVPGVSFDSGDLSQSVVSSEAACAQLCTSTPGCLTYTYNSVQSDGTGCDGNAVGTCWLKTGTGNVRSSSCNLSGVAAKYLSYAYDVPHMMAACEATPNCASFSTADGFLRAFNPSTAVDSWLSNSTCGSSGPAAVEPGSCFSPGATYVVCNGLKASGYYTAIAAYTLPPFLIESACDKDAACVGYMTKADQTAGWLLGWVPAPAAGTVALLVGTV